jgi:cell division septation protein DedD
MAVAAAVRAPAQNLRIEGSTEFQQATYAAIIGALTNSQVACLGGNPNGSDMSKATAAVIVGIFEGQQFTVQVNWSSSYIGVRDLAMANADISWLSASNIPGGDTQYATVSGGAIIGYTPITAGQQIFDSPQGAPNVTLADTFQAATPFAPGSDNSYPTFLQAPPSIAGYSGTPPGVGVIPFYWVKGSNTMLKDYSGLLIVTPLQARLLLAFGQLPLSFFTAASGDSNTDVLLVGRSNDSGIRTEVQADADYGFGQSVENQFQPIYSNGLITGVTNVGDAGFSASIGVVSALTTPQAAGCVDLQGNPFIFVGYLDSNDLATVVAANPSGHASLDFAGIYYNGRPQVTLGRYSLWSYEHVYYNGLVQSQVSLINQISSNLAAIVGSGSAFGGNGITLGAMDYSRAIEGGTITPMAPTPTPTPTHTPTPTPSPTATPTPTPSPTPTPTPTGIIMPTPSPTPTATPSPTVTPSPTPTSSGYNYYATHFTGGEFPSLTSLELGGDFPNTNNTTYVGAMNFWIRLPNVVGPYASGLFDVFEIGVNQVHIWLRDGTGSDVGKIYVEISVSGIDGSADFVSRTSAHTQADGWLHIQASWNLQSPNQASCLYVNDVSDNNLVAKLGYHPCSYVAKSPVQVSFGSDPRVPGPGEYAAAFDISEFWFSETQYVDFTNAAVRASFEATGGHPGYLGTDGSIPTDSSPNVYFHSPYNSFWVNSGTGGNFKFYGSGSLVPAATAP